MTAKALKDYFPEKREYHLFQCWVDAALLERVTAQRKADGLSWKELIEACFNCYLDETKDEKRRA